MKKSMLLALLTVVIVGLLAACSSADKVKPADQSASTDKSATPEQSASPAASATKEQKVVKISVRENTWGARKDNFLKAEKTLNEELAKDNVKVVIDWWPGIGDDELILQAQAGKKADIFINSSVDIGWELKGGLIRDIDWAASSKVFKTVPSSYTDIMKYDGHYYGVIQDMDASPVFISRKALKDIGWTDDQIIGLKAQVDKGEFVLSDLVNLAEQAKKKNSVKIGFGVEDIRFEGWKYAFGSYTYNSSQNKLVLSAAKDKEIYKFWYDAFHRGVISEGIGAVDTDKAAERFLKGELFAEFARTEFYQILRDKSSMKADLKAYDKWFNENVVWIPIPSATKGGKPVSFSNPALIFVG